MNKNKHNNIKTQTSADVGIGNGGGGGGLWGGCMIPANVSHIICTAVSYGSLLTRLIRPLEAQLSQI